MSSREREEAMERARTKRRRKTGLADVTAKPVVFQNVLEFAGKAAQAVGTAVQKAAVAVTGA
jgi:hypothetical protein